MSIRLEVYDGSGCSNNYCPKRIADSDICIGSFAVGQPYRRIGGKRFQATTQIQEATLSFIPKILSVILTIAVLGSWMLSMLTDYTLNLYDSILQFIR